ncbi:MAG: IMP cyclohydrolase [Candidatus Bathyarchaeota archaeon]|jgi:phosphoribosylaminoimidazolecarboxamide formyltransferase / IMP cyclohydrolase
MKWALISVHDKSGIVDFAKELNKQGFCVISTGGSLTTLKEGGVSKVKHVSEITGFPEILEGRIKTVHPKILGGILALRNNPAHIRELEQFQIEPIDLVICNLYPFEKITKEEGATLKTALENIDIGGPNMIRAAAKNFENVVVVVKPSRYMQVLEEYKKNGDVSFETRKVLAVEAFQQTSRYDSVIREFLEKT